jgi:uncharacterized protein (TIGR02246 family)
VTDLAKRTRALAAAAFVVAAGCASRTPEPLAPSPEDVSPDADPAEINAAARRVLGLRAYASLMRVVPAEEEPAIRAQLAAQADAWNRGDIEAFMAGYAPGDDVLFASGGDVTRGWREMLMNYQERYPDRAAMGVLLFSDLDVDVLAPDAAVVFGRWRLLRDVDPPHGVFTLVMRKIDGAWRIVQDHTSTGE